MSIVNRENAPHYTWGKDCHGWHLVQAKELSVIEEMVPPGSGEVRHYHEKSNQFFYVLSGKATIEIGGRVVQVGAKEGVWVEAGAPHQLMNREETDLHFIVTSSPPSHGDKIEASLNPGHQK